MATMVLEKYQHLMILEVKNRPTNNDLIQKILHLLMINEILKMEKNFTSSNIDGEGQKRVNISKINDFLE